MSIILKICKSIVKIWCVFCGAMSLYYFIASAAGHVEDGLCSCGGYRMKFIKGPFKVFFE